MQSNELEISNMPLEIIFFYLFQMFDFIQKNVKQPYKASLNAWKYDICSTGSSKENVILLGYRKCYGHPRRLVEAVLKL